MTSWARPRRTTTSSAGRRATPTTPWGGSPFTTYPDGTTEESTYDGEGRRLTSKDRGDGRRATSTTAGPARQDDYADGSFTTTTTTPRAGRGDTDVRRNATSYEYDVSGRRTKVIDALSHETLLTYDASRQPEDCEGPQGTAHHLRVRRDEPQGEDHLPGPAFTLTGYDALGRRVSETDQPGGPLALDTTPGSPGAGDGRQESGDVLCLRRAGNRVSQTDANHHCHDVRVRQTGAETRRTLPDGKSESKGYDGAGNLISRTDFAGQTTTTITTKITG